MGKSKFEEVLTASVLAELRSETENKYDFEWSKLVWEDLRYPFYSGLAARLYLSLLEMETASIPLAGDIVEQASFWFTYYHTRDEVPVSEIQFIEQLHDLINNEGCSL